MRRIIIIAALMCCTAGPTHAQVGDAIDLTLKLRKYYSRTKFLLKIPKFWTGYKDCRARGGTNEQCTALTTLCAIQQAPFFGKYAGLFRSLQLNQVFQLDCGSQECYQCCHVPGMGCHTSFIGFPVINCNPRYGPGTSAVGLTLLDPGAMPGDACIAIPQSCDHIPACLGDPNNRRDLRESIDAGEEHPINAPHAPANRAKYFATQTLTKWCGYLDRFHTGLPRDEEVPGFETLSDLQGFVTGRGCVGWRDNLAAVSPFDWEAELFALQDADGAVLPGPSHLNGLCQFGAIRLLESVPNLADRLAFVESTIWPDDLRAAYLAMIGDPDAALDRNAHPIVRDLLACNPGVTDYRMLAVPLAGEEDSNRIFNGCVLGVAPRVFLDAAPGAEPRQVEVRVEVRDPEAGGAHASAVPITIFWGDGRVSREAIAAGQAEASFTHTYAQAGRYAVHAMIENTSGLRGLGTVIAEAAPGDPGEASGPVVVSEVRLVNTIARADTLTGNTRSLFLELEGHDPVEDVTYRVGVSPERGIEFEQDIPLGTLIAYNTVAAPLDRLIIRPNWRDGFYTGFRKAFLRVERLEMHVFDTATGETIPVEIPLVPEAIRVYVNDAAEPLAPEQLFVDEMGRLELFLHDRERLTRRIEIDLPQDLLTAAAPGPLADDYVAPDEESFIEDRPEQFIAVGRDPDMGPPDMAVPDMGVDPDDGVAPEPEAAPNDGGPLADRGVAPDGGTDSDGGGSNGSGGGGGGCAAAPGEAAGWWGLLALLGLRRRRHQQP